MFSDQWQRLHAVCNSNTSLRNRRFPRRLLWS